MDESTAEDLTLYESEYRLVNISLGTPPQNFTVEVDLFYHSDLSLFDSKVNTTIRRLSNVRKFNTNDSSTFFIVNKNYTSDYYGTVGYVGSDIMQFGDIRQRLSFGLIDNVTNYYDYYYFSCDGALGLSVFLESHSNISGMQQIMSNQELPIFSMWYNRSLSYEDSVAQMTLGHENNQNCLLDWVYVPSVQVNEFGYTESEYAVHLSSITLEIDGASRPVNVKVNRTLVIDSWGIDQYGFMPYYLKFFFVTAANATWHRNRYAYFADCDLNKAKNVILNIGGSDGNLDESSRKIVVTPAEYIRKLPKRNECVVNINGFNDVFNNRIQMPMQFYNGHCYSYNTKTRMIGISTAVKN
ncbi:eukaryotic aspartyl protease domain-containing protein [Ditylenchus destructor]|uniref:Eukaryotic aspartyl protease domain-containing protein n=1 Tax=Ditylenchus destructor TaxID=166010 RepID=A0AAD4MGU5_9BILA|nr:eukaryotic aspartyl protease domain-containing protein [Ditylenchus destructor]